jgi:hypothetical protein
MAGKMEVANPTGFYDVLKLFGAIVSKLIRIPSEGTIQKIHKFVWQLSPAWAEAYIYFRSIQTRHQLSQQLWSPKYGL